VDIELPKWMQDNPEMANQPIVRAIPRPLSLLDVRLVYPLTNNETGETKDVIIKKLAQKHMRTDHNTRVKTWTRYIPGINIDVPWPAEEPKTETDAPCDTLRLDVDIRTYVPTLLQPPMPGSVIDELRNKYSKFRTRHDEEYIARKMAEDAEKEEKKRALKEMQNTPIKEKNRRERLERKELGKTQVLTDEMLERIGQVMARRRALLAEATEAAKQLSLQESGNTPEKVAA
jgi:large subunit ribosomal protein L24